MQQMHVCMVRQLVVKVGVQPLGPLKGSSIVHVVEGRRTGPYGPDSAPQPLSVLDLVSQPES